jgi:hypothetical protein
VAGESVENGRCERTCERFDSIGGEWGEVGGEFDEFGLGVSMGVVKERYLAAFGGSSYDFEVPGTEMIRIFVCFRVQAGWRIYSFDRPLEASCG